jgi:hypothetical protein
VRVLVACEFTGVVRDAFLARGHQAMSCDLTPSETPGPHHAGDVRELLEPGRWDLLIGHPPCTDLAVSGARWFAAKGRARQAAALDFVRTLELVPIDYPTAAEFVDGWHRHHRAPPSHKFSIGAALDGLLVGVCIVGLPIARAYADGRTLEVRRTATDGTRNVNSLLYGAAWRAAKALGYRRLITYTQAGESGASLRAAGWHVIAERPPRASWDTPSRPRDGSSYLSTTRYLWEAAP